MARTKASKKKPQILPDGAAASARSAAYRLTGVALLGLFGALVVSLLSYVPADPTLNTATGAAPENLLGLPGAIAADLLLQTLDAATFILILPLATWGWRMVTRKGLPRFWLHLLVLPFAVSAAATAATFAGNRGGFLGGLFQDAFDGLVASMIGRYVPTWGGVALFSVLALAGMAAVLGLDRSEWRKITSTIGQLLVRATSKIWIVFTGLVRRDGAAPAKASKSKRKKPRAEPTLGRSGQMSRRKIKGPKKAKPSERDFRERQSNLDFGDGNTFKLPTLDLLARPKSRGGGDRLSNEALDRNAQLLESVLDDFGIQGQIVDVSPGPVVTLYELEPAPGTKSSRVIGLAHDIARSMSVVSARVAVVPGRNAIGIELPNARRDTVFLRELMASSAFERSNAELALALGKDISGAPVIADLTSMPHLLVAGTTGSGKSVGLNAMVLSLLYRLPPDRCKLIMVDPKMLELSIYEGIPHLLTPVVTEPKKAVVALKWAVREMEERYRAMSKLGVRNIASYNKRVNEARTNKEVITRKVQVGFDKNTGQPIYEKQEFDLQPFPLIVIVIDEMADLMLVAGKDVEATVQRLSQMARAAGLHLIMATQRPSVDVITGTIKANFPTRISFQVTSKIDSRTILGEQGAEQLLGQGDMLYMVAGGRITRIHGPFVSDRDVEKVAAMLKRQGAPQYLRDVTEEPEGGYDSPYLPGGGSSENELYDKAVDIVLRDRKASTSYIQRRLKIGYNRAASIIEEMEENGVVSGPNHAGRREILVPGIDE